MYINRKKLKRQSRKRANLRDREMQEGTEMAAVDKTPSWINCKASLHGL